MYTVILVDNEIFSLIDAKHSFPFSELDFKIIGSFQNPFNALNEILKKKPNLIIMDIRMPELSGLDLLSRIRKENIQSRVIILSGYSEFSFAQEAIKYNVDEYCLKPLNSAKAKEILTLIKEKLDEDFKDSSSLTTHNSDYYTCSDNFQQLLDYMESNYAQKIILKDLTHKFHINTNYCCALFAKYKKMTFSQYLTHIRIEKAKSLITQSDTMSLNKISTMVGYSDYYHFSKVFKRITGISPSEFKKELHINEKKIIN